MSVWVYEGDEYGPILVHDAGAIDPEEWARDYGTMKYPDVIYFFAELVVEKY